MIVPAKRKYFGINRFQAAKIGETFSIESGLGGSWTVEFVGKFNGKYRFQTENHKDWPHNVYEFSPETVVDEVYILVPENDCFTTKEEIKFEGIDGWNRPIFKSLRYRNRFGSVDKLFTHGTTEEEVLAKVTEEDLCFFGTSFGCEPMGTPVSDIVIIRG